MKKAIRWNTGVKTDHDRACLEKAFYATLGHYALMLGRPAAKGELVSYEEVYASAKIRYSGMSRGMLEIVVPGEFCYKLNAGVLGIPQDSAVVLDPQFDVLKEFINIMCGDFLMRKFGENGAFEIMTPKVSMIGRKEWFAYAQQEGRGFVTEDSPIIIMHDEIKEF